MYKPKDKTLYTTFLIDFTEKYKNNPVPDNNSLPKHSICKHITDDELQNEIVDWTLQHLLLEIKLVTFNVTLL